MFKKKFNLYSNNLDVSKNCATCKFGKPLINTDDIMCQKKGLVSAKHICKKYDYNRLLKRPPKKRSVNISKLDENDYSID